MGTKPWSLSALAQSLGARLIGDGELVVDGAADPLSAGARHITYLHTPKRWAQLRTTAAACVITDERTAANRADELPCAVMFTDDKEDLWRRALDALFVDAPVRPGVHPTAVIDARTTVPDTVRIDAFCVVGQAQLGQNVHLKSHVVLDDGVVVGDRTVIGAHCVLVGGACVGADVILQPGVVIGGDGFGYAPSGDKNLKVRQVGGMVVGDDVEVGANAAIDRGQLRDTVVGKGTKIGALVQVGHGVQLGDNAVVVAGGGLGGDVDIGHGAVLAGQVGVAPYLRIGDRARVGAKSGVTRDIRAEEAKSGIPAVAHRAWLKTSAHLPHLDELVRTVRRQQEEIERLRGLVGGLVEGQPAGRADQE